LHGSHRFSSYAMVFSIEGPVLRARTYADFPGVLGRLYRLAVIDSGAHGAVVRRMLRSIAGR
jgi:hypothetical protein